jgi:hypothetical protein
MLDGVEWSASCPRPLYPLRKKHWYPLYGRLGGTQSRSGCGGEKNKSRHCTCRKSNPCRPAQNLLAKFNSASCRCKIISTLPETRMKHRFSRELLILPKIGTSYNVLELSFSNVNRKLVSILWVFNWYVTHNIHNCHFASCAVWVRNLVANFEGGTQTEGFWEHSVEDIWT